MDAFGNAYISGETWGSLDGPNAGSNDAFLTKYDASGGVLWSRQAGTRGSTISYSVAVDAAGNAYICGSTEGNLSGPNAGGRDAFVTKYDSSGSLLWSRQIGTSVADVGRAVAVDGAGNAYISGYTRGSLSGTNPGGFDPQDAFLIKYDASGELLWSRQTNARGIEYCYSVAVDAAGNAYISGDIRYSNDSNDKDAFLTKYDTSGNMLWSRQIGTIVDDWTMSTVVDAAGNAYITGYTKGSLGGTSAGGWDPFLIKYDSSGSLVWTRQFGTEQDDESESVALDTFGNAYLTGQTRGSIGGPNAGFRDVFLTKLVPVPEPRSLALIALGGLACGRRSRRTRSPSATRTSPSQPS